MAKNTRKLIELVKMIRQGAKYRTEAAKKAEAHPKRKEAAFIEAFKRAGKLASQPVETEEEKRKRLEREKKARLAGGGFVGAQNVDKKYHKIAGK